MKMQFSKAAKRGADASQGLSQAKPPCPVTDSDVLFPPTLLVIHLHLRVEFTMLAANTRNDQSTKAIDKLFEYLLSSLAFSDADNQHNSEEFRLLLEVWLIFGVLAFLFFTILSKYFHLYSLAFCHFANLRRSLTPLHFGNNQANLAPCHVRQWLRYS